MPCTPSTSAAVRLLLGAVLILQGPGASACSKTPAEAVRAFEQGAQGGEGVDAAIGMDGYRVSSLHRDAVLGRSWASVERCGHPEWPAVSVPREPKAGRDGLMLASAAPHGVPPPAGQAAVHREAITVRAGETVRLWRHEANLRLELTGVSEESGAVGTRVRVRVLAKQDEGERPRTMFGLVRGPADVEME